MKTVALGEVCTARSSLVDPTREDLQDLPHVAPDSIERDTGRLLRYRSVREDGVTSGKYQFEPGDLLYSKIRPNLNKATLVDFGGLCSADMYALKVDARHAEPRYVAFVLRSQTFLGYATTLSNRANIPKINRDQLMGFRMVLPPLDEQRRIATILDHADAIRAKRRRILGHLDTLTQSIFLGTFGALDANATVADVAELIRTGPFGSQLLHGEFVDEGIAVLGLDNVVSNEFRWAGRRYITNEKYEQLKRYTVRSGDVLISIMGTVGRCVVVPDDIPTAINTKHICAISADLDRVDPRYLRAAFLYHPASRAHLRRQTKGAIMDGLNMGIVKAMPMPLPTLSAQREFGRQAEQVNAHRAVVQRALETDDEFFDSLQSRAFSGML